MSRSAPAMLHIAFKEARFGLVEGGIPRGAGLFTADGVLLGHGRNHRVQQGDPACGTKT